MLTIKGSLTISTCYQLQRKERQQERQFLFLTKFREREDTYLGNTKLIKLCSFPCSTFVFLFKQANVLNHTHKKSSYFIDINISYDLQIIIGRSQLHHFLKSNCDKSSAFLFRTKWSSICQAVSTHFNRLLKNHL